MANKKDKPTVKNFADHTIIVPPDTLRKAIASPPSLADDPIARAEAALANLSPEFSGWMQAESDRLTRAWRKTKRSAQASCDWTGVFRVAHDIKGEAETFGFRQVGEVADSLCRLIEGIAEGEEKPLTLVEQHVVAIRAMIRESQSEDAKATAAKLAQRLRRVSDEFLARKKPDDAQGSSNVDHMGAPPLAPDAT